ncbi:MAG TPA: hypothetical protein VM011_03845 [Gammaproteobacteria bacterium]|nr:hypothetical protein [Gammaproteobacteria bacterium]
MTDSMLETLLERKLAVMFPEDFTRRRVRKILGGYGREAHEREPDRVRLAILKLAGAELQAVEKYSGYAREDYRNILAWAEHPRQAREWLMPDADEKQKMSVADLTEYENWLHDS